MFPAYLRQTLTKEKGGHLGLVKTCRATQFENVSLNQGKVSAKSLNVNQPWLPTSQPIRKG